MPSCYNAAPCAGTPKQVISRRRILQSAGGVLAVAAAAASPFRTAVSDEQESHAASTDLTGRVARYMAAARDRALPPDVARETRHRILDTIAAMVSGARLKPGEAAIRFARAQGGVPEASILTTTSGLGDQRRARQRHVRARRRDRRLRAGHQGSPRLRRRARGAGHGRTRQGLGTGSDSRGRARLRPVLPMAARARTRLTCARRIAAPKASAPRWARPLRRRRWRGSTRRACATRCRTRSSRSPVCGAGSATSSTSRRPSTSPAWARATASPRR